MGHRGGGGSSGRWWVIGEVVGHWGGSGSSELHGGLLGVCCLLENLVAHMAFSGSR